ncbi:cytochrome c2 [Dinoroseobacter shibae DFL 12 = DSM 16493]|jgi:cytochrome c|uniref:Cytochrome c2 n=1 Tax=Dinoroseobacter shibae (strain DSM 16493 / NCIMB 14021 / DFL 12) TaxID=398580 RepID=A8LQ40_DINSH|nr:c-type cytochrome [Dinoroseobacter shibae]ABV95280.1 cytochrome c2 [Dinoroseobacter shibae DFL 12 = DSM 16493]URF46686.1 cytochrome C [Dinoroseobacter shibae]URF50992.1 cytochrome C [Dinoroseobacter shibae]
MKLTIVAAATLMLTSMSAPVLADDLAATGDAAEGEKAFRQCQSCHVVQDADGNTLAGRAAKTGPNLYGVSGRTAGSVEDFRYSDLLLAANEQGVVYDEATFVAYLQDPTGYMQEVTGTGERGKMSFRVRKEEDAVNLYAYIKSLSE